MEKSPKTLDKLFNLEKMLQSPLIRHSEKHLFELIADDFVEIGKSGRLYDKTSAIQTLMTSSEQSADEEYCFNGKHLLPELVLISYETDLGRVQRSSLWRLNGQTWQIIFHQALTS